MGRAKKNVEVEAQVIARGNVVPMMTETESEEIVQYVSDEDAAREDRLVSEIRMITEQTKQVVLFNSIEIGRRLTEAKAMGNSRRCSSEPIDPWRSSSFSLPRPLPDTTCGPLPRSRE